MQLLPRCAPGEHRGDCFESGKLIFIPLFYLDLQELARCILNSFLVDLRNVGMKRRPPIEHPTSEAVFCVS